MCAMTADDFRDLALSMPGATERAHMGHPDFRVKGRIFATLRADERGGAVRLAPAEQRALMRSHPRVFSPASGAWGRQGWTMVALDALDHGTARAAVLLAWEGIVARAPARPRARAKRPAAPARRKRRRTV
jgi:predicted DNA-binding protein (MmcQ/YjbR family)